MKLIMENWRKLLKEAVPPDGGRFGDGSFTPDEQFASPQNKGEGPTVSKKEQIYSLSMKELVEKYNNSCGSHSPSSDWDPEMCALAKERMKLTDAERRAASSKPRERFLIPKSDK